MPNFKNVQQDNRISNGMGWCTSQEPRGKRTVKVPQVPFEEIALRIAI